MASPTLEDWSQLRGATAHRMSEVFRALLEAPPSANDAERAVQAGVQTLAASREALAAAVSTYIQEVNGEALWAVAEEHVPRALVALSASLGVLAATRQSAPELASTFLAGVDKECEVWGRLVRNLSGGLLYVTQENEDPQILAQFVVQGMGISGVRPSPVDGALRLDASPEPAEKLALFFGV